MSRVDLSVHLIYHDPSDLGSLILMSIIPNECTQNVTLGNVQEDKYKEWNKILILDN